MFSRVLILAAYWLCLVAVCAEVENEPLQKSQQLIVVVADSWESTKARLKRFEKAGDEWRLTGVEMRATVGRNGLGWGFGLHETPADGGPIKREGDGKSPAGVFEVDEAFGSMPRAEAVVTKLPYRQMTPEFAGVDDPKSRHYNRIVDARTVAKDWASAEEMVRPDGLYRLGVVVRHNWRQIPSAGSCIFIHEWKAEGMGTSGCTALSRSDLEIVVRWLDAAKDPLLVQLPAAEYEARRKVWKLP